jgi:hypothetical protein
MTSCWRFQVGSVVGCVAAAVVVVGESAAQIGWAQAENDQGEDQQTQERSHDARHATAAVR